jgi:exosome complex component RRP41
LKLTQPKYNKPQECRLNVKVKICSFATNRKVYKSDKRLIEMASMIKSCFEPVLQLDLYSRSEIDVYVTVLQSDGGVLAAAINAATLAFIDSG